MKKTIAAIAITLALVCAAFAHEHANFVMPDKWQPTPEEISAAANRAVAALPSLRALMKDPTSFALENVYAGVPDHKKNISDICYVFRSHNSYGGYSGDGYMRLRNDGRLDKSIFCDVGLVTDKRTGWRDITTQVNTLLNPPAPVVPPTSPEDAAKRAQQYADCLKLAVDNPNIVCKQ